MRTLCDKLDPVKRRKSTNCNLKGISHKIGNSRGDFANVITGSHRCTVSSFDPIRRSVDGALVEVSKRLKGVFDCEVRSL